MKRKTDTNWKKCEILKIHTYAQDINLEDESIKNLIYEFGPLKFIKDNDKWYIITVGEHSDLFKGAEFQHIKYLLMRFMKKTLIGIQNMIDFSKEITVIKLNQLKVYLCQICILWIIIKTILLNLQLRM